MATACNRGSRAALIGGSLCFAAVLAILVGGIAHADAAAHHRSPAATTSWVTTDHHGPTLRLDQPGTLAAGAALLLAALVLLRPRAVRSTPTQFTAHSPAPRGPPRQDH